MSFHALDVLAGPRALSHLRERGLRVEDVDVVPGASGGPKWLVLAGLDRVLFGGFLRARREPLHLIGSSIGSWRLACLAQPDPVAALDRFEQAYVEQRYGSRRPGAEEVTEVSAHILHTLLGTGGVEAILSHRWARLHVVTTLCHGLLASERRAVQLSGLGLAAFANVLSRRTLALQMQRVVFHTAGDASPFRGLADLPTRHVPLTRENCAPALLASGSIPLVLSGVRIPGAPEGVYRDGGVIDYHLDLHFGDGEGLVLYPHFYPRITPGWFDKSLRWRRALARNFDRAVVLAPSQRFVATLPGGKIPDRDDFHAFDDAERIRRWRDVRRASDRLGEEFAELVASGKWAERARPLVP